MASRALLPAAVCEIDCLVKAMCQVESRPSKLVRKCCSESSPPCFQWCLSEERCATLRGRQGSKLIRLDRLSQIPYRTAECRGAKPTSLYVINMVTITLAFHFRQSKPNSVSSWRAYSCCNRASSCHHLWMATCRTAVPNAWSHGLLASGSKIHASTNIRRTTHQMIELRGTGCQVI